MASTQDIVEQATKLGKLLLDHDAFKNREAVLRKLQADTGAQRLLNDLNRHIQTLAEKEMSGKPIEVEDKHKLEKLQGAVVTNPVLRDLQMAEMDYADLLRKINEAVIGNTEPQSPAAATSPLVNPDLTK